MHASFLCDRTIYLLFKSLVLEIASSSAVWYMTAQLGFNLFMLE